MPLLTIADAATQLATSRRTVEREIADGKLAVILVRGSRRVAQSDLDDYIAHQRRGEQWQSTSAGTAGTTVSKSAASRSRAALEQALHDLRLSSSRHSADRKSQPKAAARTTAVYAASAGTCAVGSARSPGQAASCRRGKGTSLRKQNCCRGARGSRVPDDESIDAWRERVAIVMFCSGVEMTDRQAQRIVQQQMGLSDAAAREMAEIDQRIG